MTITKMLKTHGYIIAENEIGGKGYIKTECGVTLTRKKENATRWFAPLLLNGNFIANSTQMIFLAKGTEYENCRLNEIKAAYDHGKIDGFKCCDLYAEYYGFDADPDADAIFNHGYSARTLKYINAIRKNIGIDKIDETEDFIDIENPTKIKRFVNADAYLGTYSDKWVVIADYQFNIDTFVQLQMYFAHKPTTAEIETAFAIINAENKIRSIGEIYTCYECGRKVHWLDNKTGSLNDKIARLEGKFCGFCDKG